MSFGTSRFTTPAHALAAAALVLATAALMLGVSVARAEIAGYPSSVEAYDAREVAMLPRYCIYTQLFRERVPGGNNAAEIRKWTALMGDTFDTLHHYCWALMKTNR